MLSIPCWLHCWIALCAPSSYKHGDLRGDTYAEQQLTQLIAFIFHVGRSANCQLFQTNSSVRCLHVDNWFLNCMWKKSHLLEIVCSAYLLLFPLALWICLSLTEVNNFISLGENKLCFIFFYILVIAGGCRASCRSLNLLSWEWKHFLFSCCLRHILLAPKLRMPHVFAKELCPQPKSMGSALEQWAHRRFDVKIRKLLILNVLVHWSPEASMQRLLSTLRYQQH